MLSIILENFEQLGKLFLVDNVVTAIGLLIAILLPIGYYLWQEGSEEELEWAGKLIIITCSLFVVGIVVGLILLLYSTTAIFVMFGFGASVITGVFVSVAIYNEYF